MDLNLIAGGAMDRPSKVDALISWTEFRSLPFPDQKWTIRHLIPNEGFVILASPSGEKKTWIALEMARCIAKGEEFLRHPDFAVEKGNVLYIDQEMSKAELQRRGKQLNLDESDGKIWIYNGEGLNLNEDDQTLRSWIRRYDIKVVFIDTLRAVAGGLREDKAEEVRKFFNLFKSLKDQGVALVFLDHCRKPNPFEGKTPKKEQLFASQDKLASVEILIMVRSEEGSDIIDVHQKKNRTGKECAPFRIIVKDDLDNEGSVKTNLSYALFENAKELKFEEAKAFIPDALREGGKTRKEVMSLTQKERRIGQKNTSEALRELESEGKIKVEKRGRENFYFLPDEESPKNGKNV